MSRASRSFKLLLDLYRSVCARMGRSDPMRTSAVHTSRPWRGMQQLEPRILFSASPLADILMPDPLGDSPAVLVDNEDQVAQEALHRDRAALFEGRSDEHVRHELIIVDTNTPDYSSLVADIWEGVDDGRQVDIVWLDGDGDGLEQLSEILSHYEGLDGLHIVSHAADGAVQLGESWLTSATLAENAQSIGAWSSALGEDADILFYGCDLASSADGRELVDALSRITGADVAASTDLTGQARLGGDWDLEYTAGHVETAVAFSAAVQDSWDGVLATFTVSNTNDSGAGSLRQAIIDANGGGGADVIEFNIGSGPQTINLSSALPVISEAVTIDGTTQPGYSGTPLITLDGSSAGGSSNGLEIAGGNSTIKGLVIKDFGGNGIYIHSAGGNTIQGNYIGTNSAGTADNGNDGQGININDTANNVIGGINANEGNVISGNDLSGIIIWGTNANNNTIQGNFIGTNATGTADVGNTDDGIRIGGGADNNTIGGTDPAAGNVISGNSEDGIELTSAGTNGTLILGNHIGTNAAGDAAIANGRHGLVIYDGVANTTVGSVGAGNVISGNTDDGVVIDGNGDDDTANNVLQANHIGVNAAGTAAIANGNFGIHLFDEASNNTIGGSGAGEGNIISGNDVAGIYITDNGTDDNALMGNYVGLGADGSTVIANGGNGIDINQGASGTLVGGNGTDEGNVISGNNNDGVTIWGTGTTGTLVRGNFIGTDAGGTLDRGNRNDGVIVSGYATGNIVGGTSSGDGNLIAWNDGDGVQIKDSGTDGNAILRNMIHSNSGKSIGIGAGTNDAGDGDSGANEQQNFPVITAAATTGTSISLNGSINSTPSTAFRIEFFAASGPGTGNAQTFLGHLNITTTTSGSVGFGTHLTASVAAGTYITATATDSSNNTSEFSVNFQSTSSNASPVVNDQSFNVNENAVNTTSVGTVAATDPDVGDDLTYAITGGTGQTAFDINSSTGEITVLDSAQLDRETTSSFTLDVQVTDDGSPTLSDTATITINLNDLNDNTPIITAAQSFDLAEDAANTTVVGTVAATDADLSTTYGNWTITAGNTDGIFEIDANTGQLRVLDNTNLDRETTDSYVLTLQVDDGVNTSATQTVNVNITDINDNAPVITAAQSFNVAENAANTTAVGTVAVTDADLGTIYGNWTITAGNTDGIFEIDASTGQIRILDNTNLDRETTDSYVLTLQVDDGVNTSATETVTVTITDINDNAPVITAAQSFNVAEKADNTTAVGTVAVTDADLSTVYGNWTITAGNTDGIFEIDANTGQIRILDNTNLDRETTDSYVLTLQVDDGVNTSATETVTVTITDINDTAPVVTAAQSFDVAENAANTTSVGTVLATDADLGTVYSNWTIVSGNTDGIFQINSSTGEITVLDNTNLDHETTGSYTLGIRVSDGVQNSTVESVTINITDTNDDPVLTLPGSLGYIENAAATAIASTAAVTDADATDFDTGTLTVSFTAGGDADDRLSIIAVGDGVGQVNVNGSVVLYEGTAIGTCTGGTEGSTPLVITWSSNADAAAVEAVVRSIAYESLSNAPVTSKTAQFALTDGDGGSDVASVSITITAVNDAPFMSSLSGDSVAAPNDGTVVLLDAGVAAAIADADMPADLSGGSLQVSGSFLDTTDQLRIDTTGTVGLSAGFVNGSNVSIGGTIIGTLSGVSDSGVTISFNGNATTARVDTLLQSFTFETTSSTFGHRVVDLTLNDGDGTANGGDATSVATVFVLVTSGANGSVTVDEDNTYTFTASDFDFTGTTGSNLESITVTTLPANGTLRLNGSAVSVNDTITKAQIDAGQLTFDPVGDENGVLYASLEFHVNGGNTSVTVLAGEPNSYTLTGGSLANTDAILANASNFGAGGTFQTGISVVGTSATIDAAYLAQGQIVFNGFVPDANWTGAELAALDTWVQAGGILISTSDSAQYDAVSDYYGLTIGGSAGQIYNIDDATHPIMNGPFGLVGNNGDPFNAADLVSYFDGASLAPGDQVIAVDPSSGNPTMVVRQVGSGWILFTSDEGVFRGGTTGGGAVSSANDILAANVFAWAAGLTPASQTHTVDITVNAVNDAPNNTVPGTQTVNEETPTAIAGISVTDIDANSANITTRLQVSGGLVNVTLSGSAVISTGANGSSDLTILGTVTDINSTLATLTYTGGTDLVGVGADTLTITTNDLGNTGGGALQDISNIQIDITDLNDTPPVITASQSFNVSEAAANLTSVGTVVATDADTVGTIQDWSIVSGNTDGIFQINPATGEITILDNSNLDREGTGVYMLGIQVGDGVNTSATETVTINITDVNDNAPVITPAQSFNVSEDAADTTLLGTVAVTDADLGTVYGNWTITAGNTDGIFEIDANTGQIRVLDNTNLDRETTDSYVLTLQVDDGVNTSATQTVAINVTDVNDNLPVITPGQSFNVSEDAADTTPVGTVAATDADLATIYGNWTITAGNTDGIFEIDANTGQIRVLDNTTLDRETTDSYVLTLQVDDGVNTSTTQTVTVNILDANDNAPVITPAQAFNVSEDATDTTAVGTVAVTDADLATVYDNWTITAGNSDGIFEIDANTGQIRVFDNTNLDRETSDTYVLTLQVDDGVNTSATQTVTISVLDVNDTAPVITPAQSFNISEDAINTTALGTVAVTDADLGTVYGNWTITAGNTDGIFEIDANTGQLRVFDNTNLDRESTDTYVLTLQVDDGVNTSATQTITINVTDVNDTAPVITPGQSFSVSEDAVNTTALGTVAVTDADLGTVFGNWSITAGNTDGIFEIDSNTGQIRVLDNTNLDRETTDSYVLTLQVDDGVNTSATQTVTIGVTDVNDNAPIITPGQSFNLPEDAINTTPVGAVGVIDADLATVYGNWSITADTDGIFHIDSNTGQLRVLDNTNLDFETTNTYVLTLQVDDGVNSSATQTVTINITDVNDAPILLTNSTLAVHEADSATITTAQLRVTDVDNTDLQITYTITTPPAHGTLRLDGSALNGGSTFTQDDINKGRLVYEHDGTFLANDSFQFAVDDSAGGTIATTTFNIGVILNYAPTTTGIADVVVDEDSPNTIIDLFAALDDLETADNALVYQVIADTNPELFDSTEIDAVAGTLTLDLGQDRFGSADLTMQVTDERGKTVQTTFNVTVNAVNDAPVSVGNNFMDVDAGHDVVVSSEQLQLIDVDNTADEITFTVTDMPETGTIKLAGVALNVGNTFTQQDINNGLLTYNHDIDGGLQDSFSFVVSDSSGATVDATVTIESEPIVVAGAPDNQPEIDPVVTVDEDEAETETETESDEPSEAEIAEEMALTPMPVSPPEEPTDLSGLGQQFLTIDTPDLRQPTMNLGDLLNADDKDSKRPDRAAEDQMISGVTGAAEEIVNTALDTLNQFVAMTVVDHSELFSRITAAAEQIHDRMAKENRSLAVGFGTAAGMSIAASTGYTIWAIRGGTLLASVLSAMPICTMMDPLAVLDESNRKVQQKRDADDDSAEDRIRAMLG